MAQAENNTSNPLLESSVVDEDAVRALRAVQRMLVQGAEGAQGALVGGTVAAGGLAPLRMAQAGGVEGLSAEAPSDDPAAESARPLETVPETAPGAEIPPLRMTGERGGMAVVAPAARPPSAAQESSVTENTFIAEAAPKDLFPAEFQRAAITSPPIPGSVVEDLQESAPAQDDAEAVEQQSPEPALPRQPEPFRAPMSREPSAAPVQSLETVAAAVPEEAPLPPTTVPQQSDSFPVP
ncbi:hypothetical protein ACFOD4_21645, partial [Pseudoroseomonas globiformis]